MTTKPRLVYLYGPPAVGKLTVASELSAQTGIRLFHNHLTVDAIKAVFESRAPPSPKSFIASAWMSSKPPCVIAST